MTNQPQPDGHSAKRADRIPLQGGGWLEPGSVFDISSNLDAVDLFYSASDAHLPADMPKQPLTWMRGHVGQDRWREN